MEQTRTASGEQAVAQADEATQQDPASASAAATRQAEEVADDKAVRDRMAQDEAFEAANPEPVLTVEKKRGGAKEAKLNGEKIETDPDPDGGGGVIVGGRRLTDEERGDDGEDDLAMAVDEADAEAESGAVDVVADFKQDKFLGVSAHSESRREQ